MAKFATPKEPGLDDTPQEFIDENGVMLFDDIDGAVDDAWIAAMQKRNRRPSKIKKAVDDSALVNDMADMAHRVWSEWMDYLFSVSIEESDGSVIIPAELVSRWKRQAKTDYDELPDGEGDTDVTIAKRYLRTILETREKRRQKNIDNAPAE